MSDIAIKVENLSKLYQLGEVGTGTLSKDLNRLWAKMRGKEDPYAKIGQANDRTKKGESEFVWALKDINFEVKQGEVLGIIGKNGAGKSTLLKILSKITSPTTGKIYTKGRIASLLEVGTGFHPEMTGRENIYLNGAILGMRKWEIDKKFDEIVDFAGVQTYIDTPVKRYSSGMYVRLAFAVAAFLEPEILIVDEVLAVGDAEFQKKCLGRMKDVSTNDGRTVLFVSHNMSSVKELCNEALLLKNGTVSMLGPTFDIVRDYLKAPISVIPDHKTLSDHKTRRGNGEARFIDIQINDGDEFVDPEKIIRLKCSVQVFSPIPSLYFSFIVRGSENSEFVTSSGLICIKNEEINENIKFIFEVDINPGILRTGLFPLYFWLGRPKNIHFSGESYPYDVVDSVYYLNSVSDKSVRELGYNPLMPVGYFSIKTELKNILVSTS